MAGMIAQSTSDRSPVAWWVDAARRLRLRAPARADRPDPDRTTLTRRVCWSTGGVPPPNTGTSTSWPEILRPGDLLVVNETKVIPARLPLLRVDGRQGRGPDARAARRRAEDGGRRSCAPLASSSGARCWSPLTVRRSSRSANARRPATRSRSRCSVRSTRSNCWPNTARCHCRPTSPNGWPTPTGTRRSTPDNPGSAAAPTAGLHFTDELFDRLAQAGIEQAKVELVVGLDTFRPITEDDPLGTSDAHRALPGARRDDPALPGRRTGGGRRYHVGAGARIGGRSGRAGGSHRHLHPPRFRVAGRRPADDQLPPAANDAADDDRRLRRRPLAIAVRRRRCAATTASSASATRCCSTATRPRCCHVDDRSGTAVAGPCPFGCCTRTPGTWCTRSPMGSIASLDVHPVEFETVATDGRPAPASPPRRTARTRRRCSCRSAPAGRSSTSAPTTTTRSAPRSCSATPTT